MIELKGSITRGGSVFTDAVVKDETTKTAWQHYRGLVYLTIGKKLDVPLYDIATIATGFFIGYNKGKGVDVTPTVEYLTKYGPTTLAIYVTSLLTKRISILAKYVYKPITREFEDGDLNIVLPNDSKKKYKELDEYQKQKITPKLVEALTDLKSKSEHPSYLKDISYHGLITAAETTLGYIIGDLCSQIH